MASGQTCERSQFIEVVGSREFRLAEVDDAASEEMENLWPRRYECCSSTTLTAVRLTVRSASGSDGTEYEIDLNAEHAQALRDALARYVQAARRAGFGARRSARGGRRASGSGVDSTEVREWAKAQGIDVKDRGRVPAELVVKFKAATGQ